MNNLVDKRVLITSGPTRGYIDAVRYITNSSTGKLGSLIATEYLKNKAKVTFIYGKDSALPGIKNKNLKLIEITTAADLLSMLKKELKSNKYKVMIHLAAVSDYESERISRGKLKSDKRELVIKLKKTPKIIERIKLFAPEVFLVGFKLEVGISKEELISRACNSLVKNNADLVVANDLMNINESRHHAFIIDRNKKIVAKANTKIEIAKKLIKLIQIYSKKRKSHPKASPLGYRSAYGFRQDLTPRRK